MQKFVSGTGAFALIVASLDLDADARIAALLFAASDHVEECGERLKVGFGDTVAGVVAGSAETAAAMVVAAVGCAPAMPTGKELDSFIAGHPGPSA